MNAQDWKILLSAYADGEVSPEEAAQAEKLLLERAECRTYFEELRKISSSLGMIPDETLSPDAELKVFAAVHKEGSMKPAYWKKGAAVAATVLVVVLVFDNYARHGIQGRLRDASTIEMTAAVPMKPQEQIAFKKSEAVDWMPNMLSRGVQGRLKSSSDDIGDQFATSSFRKDKDVRRGSWGSGALQEKGNVVALASVAGKSVQYEPYYSTSVVNNRAAFADAELSAKSMPMARNGYGYGGNVDGSRMAYDRSLVQAYSREYYPSSQNIQYAPGNTEEYKRIEENSFFDAANDPLSTLSADVDTASYSNVRRFLSQRQMPPEDAVRIEEMVNYFSYDYPQPWFGQSFSITTDLAACPWAPGHQLMRIGLKGKVPSGSSLPSSNLVFLIDVSGSMADANKLPLLKEGLKMMVQQLRPQDYVSIVFYASSAHQLLAPTTGADKRSIIGAIESLRAEGSTAGGEGIQLAYQVARQSFIPGGNNRVILATDGDFNVGASSVTELERMIEERRRDGIFLTVLGFGEANLKDNRMQALADKGNGNYSYIDSLQEARKVLVSELGSTLFTIAKDVKIQVEFNPALVKSYRLIGYEKRVMAKEDFNNDRKDAGEIGAGHTVTALYEIVPAGSFEWPSSVGPNVDPLKYRQKPLIVTRPGNNSEIATVKLRYKDPDGNTSKLIAKTVKRGDYAPYPKGDFAWATSVAEFGMLLRGSDNRGYASYEHVLSNARNNIGNDPEGLRAEFVSLVETARSIDPQPQRQPVPVDDVYYDHSQPVDGSGQINFK